ncbi:unnamed protein product [Paramecium sonneborni]|uniref:EF-hand domain-containing protein n=1 Tax=Paramecium sonneborni TaxID=65129 RepID=A0A8S1QW96_9CILI|nr:unnamed protein product [Paramecium sonneborni]
MQLRKERIHYHGKTNKDLKQIQKFVESGDLSDIERPRIQSLNSSNRKNFPQLLESRRKMMSSFVDPIVETKNFTTKKYEHHDIGYPRQAHLEEKQLRKRAFCGDSNTLYNRKEISRLADRDEEQYLGDKVKLANQKIEENAKGIQETQLVGLENKITLDGKVDLEKVRDIKRSIRRRYANRKNFQKIFNSWDEDANGAISVKNLYNMVNKMGININQDEAKVLLASADKDGSNDLGMDEFMDLIFNDKDILNVDFKQLDTNQNNTINILIQDAQQAYQRKHHNQINIMLKNRQIKLGQWLLEADEKQEGYLSQKKFEEVIQKLRIDEKILSNDDIKEMANNFKQNNQSIDYKQFINHLKQFQLKEEVYDDPYAIKEQVHLIKHKQEQKQKINAFDPTKVNGWHLERMRYRANNMINKLKKYLPEKENFQEYLQEKLNGETINQKEFNQIVVQFLNSVNETHHQFDIESLLSVVQFNQYKTQSKAEILRIIYEENDDEFFERAQQQIRQPPPPKEKAIIQGLKLNDIQDDDQLDNTKIMYYNKECGLSMNLPNINKQVQAVLKKVDDKIFNKRERQLKIFKEFDIDQDGYVSQVDMQQRMKHILTQDEIGLLIQYLDPENKGFNNFTEFSQKIRNGMTILDENGTQLINVNTQPSKTTIVAASSFLPELQKSIDEFKRPFIASKNRSDYKPSTRYGATPYLKDTFANIVPLEKSGLWASAEQRFNKNREEYLQDEKKLKEYRQDQKMERIRSYQKEIRERIKSQDDRCK